MNVETAQRLADLRRSKGFSQEGLARKLGLSRQAVSKWERAESSPDTENLISLAKLYGVSLDELLNPSDEIEDDIEWRRSWLDSGEGPVPVVPVLGRVLAAVLFADVPVWCRPLCRADLLYDSHLSLGGACARW